MKFLVYSVTLALVSVVNSYPVNMLCVPMCNLNVTANAEFVNDWLNHSSATGLHQLRNSHKGSVINELLKMARTGVS